MRRTHRLYWRIWFAVLASLALFTLLAGLLWKAIGERPYRGTEHALAELVVAVLPPPGAEVEAQRGALLHWQQRLRADLALFGADSRRVTSTADDFPAAVKIDTDDDPVDWVRTPRGTAFALQLPDGRVLLARREGGARSPFGLLSGLALIMLAVGVGAYPVARRLTRRLERLQQSVERLGRGDLRARVDASGCDEVAQLAGSFNQAAARIEELVQSHRSLLANASHELRSPLTRVRLAIEMLDDAPPPRRAALRREVEQGIGEIDVLVEEILLAARLQATAEAEPRREFAEVDLTALAAEECARAEVPLDADTVKIDGDTRLLRRLLRNLIDNARRHGSARRYRRCRSN
jgi:signal transduction histidine kinase